MCGSYLPHADAWGYNQAVPMGQVGLNDNYRITKCYKFLNQLAR